MKNINIERESDRQTAWKIDTNKHKERYIKQETDIKRYRYKEIQVKREQTDRLRYKERERERERCFFGGTEIKVEP